MKITVVSPKDRDAKIQNAIRHAAQVIIDMNFNDDGAALLAALKKMHDHLEQTGMQPPPFWDFRYAAIDIANEVMKRLKLSAEIAATLN